MGYLKDRFINMTNPDTILMLTNVVFFTIVQTLFFVLIAAKQYDKILEDKVNFFNEFDKNLKVENKFVNVLHRIFKKKYQEKAKEQIKGRTKFNTKRIFTFVTPFTGAVILILIVFIIRLFKNNSEWQNYHTFILFTIAGAFTTELIYFFFIVQRYIVLGDSEMLYKIYYAIKNGFRGIKNGNCYSPRVPTDVSTL